MALGAANVKKVLSKATIYVTMTMSVSKVPTQVFMLLLLKVYFQMKFAVMVTPARTLMEVIFAVTITSVK